jgi:hypothetical protein
MLRKSCPAYSGQWPGENASADRRLTLRARAHDVSIVMGDGRDDDEGLFAPPSLHAARKALKRGRWSASTRWTQISTISALDSLRRCSRGVDDGQRCARPGSSPSIGRYPN